jgi:methylglutaconyl-CoA hydratase
MNAYNTIEISGGKNNATIWLNRPDVRNAFNAEMIEELTVAVSTLGSDKSLRLLIIRGRGKSFCAGADLNWMKESITHTREQNYDEALKLSDCFYKIYSCPIPVITLVHGASTGGANGLVAASDIAICSDDAIFSLSEIRLGLVPSVIAPYIIKRIGEFPARELMLTGRRITGREAAERGLVNQSCQVNEIDQALENIVAELSECGPRALGICKQLIAEVSSRLTIEESVTATSGILAEIRISEEGQEGMAAFLEKRKPRWAVT